MVPVGLKNRVQRVHLVLPMLVSVMAAVAASASAAEPVSRFRAAKSGESSPRPPWRALADYPRPPAPDTGWGIHDDPGCDWKAKDLDAFFKELRQRYGFTWFKVLDCGMNKVDVVEAASRNGVEPVVRIYVSGPSPFYPRPGDEEKRFREIVRTYVAAGAHYFESGNEPNLGLEWSPGEFDKPDPVGRLCRQWLRVRRIITEEGGIPVFYAMTPGSAGKWYADCFETFRKMGKIEAAFAGCAIGAHLCSLNHPLDYPFNAKKNLPHANPKERFESLMKDNTCYLLGELIMHLMDEYLPYPIPILSTEGGAALGASEDRNYPKVTPELHRDMNLEIFQRFDPRHPKYWGDPLFAQMSWIYHARTGSFMWDSWFDHPQYGDLPILAALEKARKFDRGVAFRKPATGRGQ